MKYNYLKILIIILCSIQSFAQKKAKFTYEYMEDFVKKLRPLIEQSPEKAFNIAKEESDKGNMFATLMLASSYEPNLAGGMLLNLIVEPDNEKASFYISKIIQQADLWDARSILEIGNIFNEKPYYLVTVLFMKAAERGNAEAQYRLGEIYLGKDTWKNEEQFCSEYQERGTMGLYYYRKAADQGDARAQAALGYIYFNGFGFCATEVKRGTHVLEIDYKESFFWTRKAAEQGNARGQNNLGYLYGEGYGTRKDKAKQIFWYRKACKQNYRRACENLENMGY